MDQRRFRQLSVLLIMCGWLSMAGSAWSVISPTWQQLTPAQQAILSPVQVKWPAMSTTQRQRLLGVAAKYPTLRPDAQQRFQKRLIVWSSLTQAQRDLARKNYLKLKHLPPNKRRQIKQKLLQAHPPSVANPSVHLSTPQRPTSAEAVQMVPAVPIGVHTP